MLAQDNIDFKNIDWGTVDLKKAEFIYREALEHHESIIADNNRINDKALGLLSFTMPVMAALAGYFAITWGSTSIPLFAATVSSCLSLFGVMVLLLLIIVPRGIYPGTGSPAAYFTADFYKGDMRHLLIGNIMNLHTSIMHDKKIMYTRGAILRAVVFLCAVFPAASFIVFLCLHFARN
jgi:hypothetical protein